MNSGGDLERRKVTVTIGDSTILIDCSSSGRESDVINGLKKFRINLDSVKLIILTHSHYDHCGCLCDLKKHLKNAKVLIHRQESDFLKNGKCEYPKGTGVISKVVSYFSSSKMFEKKLKFKPVVPDIEMEGEVYPLDEFGFDGKKCFVLHTPGHSLGSCSAIIDKFAFVGDTLFNLSIYKVFPPFANDVDTLLRSWKRLLDTNCEYYFPGHGGVIKREIFEKTFASKTK